MFGDLKAVLFNLLSHQICPNRPEDRVADRLCAIYLWAFRQARCVISPAEPIATKYVATPFSPYCETFERAFGSEVHL
jgi:hypothetical protein